MDLSTEWNLKQTLTTTDTSLKTEAPSNVLNADMDIALLILNIIFAVVGVITNTVNVYAFFQIGWKESVTLTLLFLSCSDLSFSSMQAIKSSGLLVELLETTIGFPISLVDPFIITVFSVNLGFLSYTATMLITTYLAVTRCMCVSKPLHFRSMFTVKRTLIALLLFVLFPYAVYAPVFAETGIAVRFDSVHNISRPVLWVSERRAEVRKYAKLILYLLVPAVCQALIIVSVVFLIAGLKSTSSFRNAMKSDFNGESVSGKSAVTQSPPGKLWTRGEDVDTEKQSEESKLSRNVFETSRNLSGKELQVARQVILVCTVFFITNLPGIGIAIAQMAVSEFGLGKLYHKTYVLAYDAVLLLMLLNSCSTIFIYLKFNTAFRKKVLQNLTHPISASK